eukprot:4960786-Prorocentrum_lima.AAC.1
MLEGVVDWRHNPSQCSVLRAGQNTADLNISLSGSLVCSCWHRGAVLSQLSIAVLHAAALRHILGLA